MQATAAELNGPAGIAVDSAGDLFIADQYNNVVREVNLATGTITTVAGNGTAGYSGDNGSGHRRRTVLPQGVAVDAAGDLFIADAGNNGVPRGESRHRRDHHRRRQWEPRLQRR